MTSKATSAASEIYFLPSANSFPLHRTALKGHLYDDWAAPSANYEMAVIAWFEKNLGGADSSAVDYKTADGTVVERKEKSRSSRKAKIDECEEYLQKAAKWDAYVLDSRIGLKITTGVETLRVYKVQHGL